MSDVFGSTIAESQSMVVSLSSDESTLHLKHGLIHVDCASVYGRIIESLPAQI